MSHKVLFVALLVMFALGLSVMVVDAQGPKGGTRVIATAADAGTGFTYQGQLKNNGALVNGTCELQVGLWDALTFGTQVGVTQTVTPTVTNGLFTVQLNASEQITTGTAFNGDARYLASAVRCPSGGGGYTTLTPRQALTPAPMAFALPGLYTQQNGTSTNIIGGWDGNAISATVVGATISGGGAPATYCGAACPNRVTDDYGTVGGGYINQAGNSDPDTTDACCATVGGGFLNTASGSYATIGGGAGHIASGSTATIGGGNSNTASSTDATVGGGRSNASGSAATIGGGIFNTASGSAATIGGGDTNTASGDNSSVPGGIRTVASHFGEMAYASGRFSANGDAQTSIYVVRNTTTNITATELFLDGATGTQRITVAVSRTLTFDILVVAKTSAGSSAGYHILGVIENQAGATSFIGTPTVTTLGEDVAAWDVAVVADNTNDALVVQVTGAASTTIRWVATVRTVEVQN